jgi:WD40 repeat protein
VAAFSHDERTLYTATSENVRSGTFATLWDITKPQTPRINAWMGLPTPQPKLSATFSPDDSFLVIGDSVGNITEWDLTTPVMPRERSTVRQGQGPIFAVAMADNGQRLATADNNGLITLWDPAASPKPRKLTELRTASVVDLTLSPDGQTVQAVEFPPYGVATLLRWHLNTDRSANVVCDQIHPKITQQEWRRYFLELPYQPVCDTKGNELTQFVLPLATDRKFGN